MYITTTRDVDVLFWVNVLGIGEIPLISEDNYHSAQINLKLVVFYIVP